MKYRSASVFAIMCMLPLFAAGQSIDGHPNLTGMWNGGPQRGLAIRSDDPFGAYLAARDGTLLNFERDNTIIRRMDPNKPLYRPQFWEKVQKLDQDGTTADPSFGCMPGGVPRMGPPAKIVHSPAELLFFYISPPAQGWGDQYRIIPIDGRQHTPLDQLDGTWKANRSAIGRETLW